MEPIRDVEVLLLADREPRPDGIDLRDARQHAGRRDEVAHLHLGHSDDAVDQRADPREADVQLGLVRGGARGLDGRDRRVVNLDVVIELALRNRTRLGERTIPFHVSRRSCRVSDALGELRVGLVERRAKGTRVDLEQQFVLPDE